MRDDVIEKGKRELTRGAAQEDVLLAGEVKRLPRRVLRAVQCNGVGQNEVATRTGETMARQADGEEARERARAIESDYVSCMAHRRIPDDLARVEHRARRGQREGEEGVVWPRIARALNRGEVAAKDHTHVPEPPLQLGGRGEMGKGR